MFKKTIDIITDNINIIPIAMFVVNAIEIAAKSITTFIEENSNPINPKYHTKVKIIKITEINNTYIITFRNTSF